jgi:hypothetical protein
VNSGKTVIIVAQCFLGSVTRHSHPGDAACERPAK